MASNLSKKVSAIENCIALLGFLMERLRFLQPSTTSLIHSAAGCEQFSSLGFLEVCRDELRRGAPFPAAWRKGLREQAGDLGPHAAVLEPLAGSGPSW